jgi:RES domain
VRPRGLRLDAPTKTWWRIDTAHPSDWAWAPYPQPKGRFDPLSGRFRARYAANRPAVAARERFAAKTLIEADGDLWLVELTTLPRSLHLTRQVNLDALGLDDRVSTGRIDVASRRDPDPLLATCGQLSDAVFDWWAGRPPALVYRSRTTPSVGRSIVFTEPASPRVVQARRLAEATALHAHLVLQAGFTVPSGWLGS